MPSVGFFILDAMMTESLHHYLQTSARGLGAFIGHTPLHQFGAALVKNPRVEVYGKMEWAQMGESIKARPAYSIIRKAIENEDLDENRILLDATGGDTGVAYASIARELGLRVLLCLPENVPAERKETLSALGAETVYTAAGEGTDGARAAAQELAMQDPDRYFYADQYQNDNNWKAHYYTTAPEIYVSVPRITHFVAGMGTTGTFTGTGKRLRELNPAIQLIALQPEGPQHGLGGWKHLKTAQVPGIYDPGVADWVVEISTGEAYNMLRKLYEEEGLLVSPSAAANVAGALKIAEQVEEGTIVTVLPDLADSYPDALSQMKRA